MPEIKLLYKWCRARRMLFLYVAILFALQFIVYGLYGYPWGVAGYTVLLGLVAGAVFATVDYVFFALKHKKLEKLAGRFPTEKLPPCGSQTEEDYVAIINQLEDERARLEQANEVAKLDADEYYSLWAHQIKTPIAGMRLLLQSAQKKQGEKSRAGMEQEMFRIEKYVDMVLQYQRLSSLQNDLLLQRIETAALVKQAAKNCATLFIYKGLPFEIKAVCGSIITDQKWFVFVLEQLYSNALKYTNNGRVLVYSQDENTLVVEDTGMGIPPEDLPRVFERGFTGAVGRSERSSTGIGLYLCRQIMQKLGFGISVESTFGKGTRVLLHLQQVDMKLDDF